MSPSDPDKDHGKGGGDAALPLAAGPPNKPADKNSDVRNLSMKCIGFLTGSAEANAEVDADSKPGRNAKKCAGVLIVFAEVLCALGCAALPRYGPARRHCSRLRSPPARPPACSSEAVWHAAAPHPPSPDPHPTHFFGRSGAAALRDPCKASKGKIDKADIPPAWLRVVAYTSKPVKDADINPPKTKARPPQEAEEPLLERFSSAEKRKEALAKIKAAELPSVITNPEHRAEFLEVPCSYAAPAPPPATAACLAAHRHGTPVAWPPLRATPLLTPRHARWRVGPAAPLAASCPLAAAGGLCSLARGRRPHA